ncbi:MAG: polyphosphate kinase 1, partial [Candidatus Dormibacteraeota bacterium]|nr:polyphosphate kinase 1 [Candidatus Dormibacteraeota bacterium]
MAQKVKLSAATSKGSNGRPYLNRELSRLDFDDRVLTMAENRDLPLLERVHFLSIFSRSIDEIFQIRVAGLQEQVQAAVPTTAPDGMSPAQQLRAIRARVEGFVDRTASLFTTDLRPALEAAGIRIRDAESLSKDERAHLAAEFREHIFPVLTPLAVDPAHPFPYISHLSLNLAVIVRDPLRRVQRFARVKVPPVLPRFTRLPGEGGYLPLEQLIAINLQSLFPGMEVVDHHPFRITRDADLDLVESEAEDLLFAIQSELRRRRRQGRAVRLEVDPDLPAEIRELLVRELELEAIDVYPVPGLLDLGGLEAFYDLDRPDLKPEPWTPITQPRLRSTRTATNDIFATLAAGDVLVQHPYDSFSTSVEAFIDQAASDPAVLAIKQTLYRTSGPASPIARALIRAAEAGKQVVALVELKARGDEQANIAWAQALEEAGVHVVYGLVGLKTHAKVTLVVRLEESGLRYYVHIGTGNYNPRTAEVYEDVGLLSSAPELGLDVSELFNLLTGYSRQRRYRRLLVAPSTLRPAILDLIRREGEARDGRIIIKVNNLVDQQVIDGLYAASSAGAEIDLIVRGICCLRPGVPGLSDRIRVRSVVGRFLEHSRLFRFGSEKRGVEFYLGSADMMPRNLDRRVEAVVPILDSALRERLEETLRISLADDTLAWQLGPDGRWTKAPTVEGVNSQEIMQDLARERSAGRNGAPNGGLGASLDEPNGHNGKAK